MGHTVPSQRKMIEVVLKEFEDYGKTLRKDQKIIFNEMLDKVYNHIGNISYVGSVHVWAFVLLSIIFEQELKIKDGFDRYISVEKQTSLLEHTRR